MEDRSAQPVARLVLETASTAPIEARVVRYGDRFGPGRAYVNRGAMPIVEFRRLDVSPRIAYMASYSAHLFASIPLDVRFAPDGRLPYALPIAEVNRLVAWLDELAVIARPRPIDAPARSRATRAGSAA